MKYFAILVMLLTLSFPLTAQQPAVSSPVAVSSSDKTALETLQSKLTGLQIQGTTVQNSYNSSMASIKWQFTFTNKAYTDLIEVAKKRLGLPTEAVFDSGTYTFTVPVKPVASPPTEVKK